MNVIVDSLSIKIVHLSIYIKSFNRNWKLLNNQRAFPTFPTSSHPGSFKEDLGPFDWGGCNPKAAIYKFQEINSYKIERREVEGVVNSKHRTLQL